MSNEVMCLLILFYFIQNFFSLEHIMKSIIMMFSSSKFF